MKAFEKWWENERKNLTWIYRTKHKAHVKEGWKGAFERILKEADRISDELIEIPMCKELYDFIKKELGEE
jgi:hypothetical protein